MSFQLDHFLCMYTRLWSKKKVPNHEIQGAKSKSWWPVAPAHSPDIQNHNDMHFVAKENKPFTTTGISITFGVGGCVSQSKWRSL